MDYDNLNNIQTENLPLADFDIDKWFDEMDISEEQKEKRKEAADELLGVLLFLFALFETWQRYQTVSLVYVYSEFRNRFQAVTHKYARNDDYIGSYIDIVTNNVFSVTVDRTAQVLPEEELVDMENTSYWLSDGRAALIAVNEANAILNYEELQEAIDEGMTKKQWVTMEDKRVRHTHRRVNGLTVNIEDYFPVGDTYLLVPRDEVNDTSGGAECVNCRCSLRFY